MNQRTIWRRVGLIIAICCVPAAAADKNGPTTGEPPLEYVLTIDGQDVAINSGQTVKAKIGDREVKLRLTPRPERLLKLPGLSLRYPAHYTYESDQSDKDAPQWTLQGRNTLVIITRANTAGAIEPVVKETMGAMVSKYGEDKVKRSEAELTVGGQRIKAAKIDVLVLSQKLRQYVFGLKTGDGSYLMILQETPKDDGSSDDETKELITLLDKGLVTRQ